MFHFYLLLKSVELSSPAFYSSCTQKRSTAERFVWAFWINISFSLRRIHLTFGMKGLLHLPKIDLFMLKTNNQAQPRREKVKAHWVWNFHVRFFVFLILSYQNACYGCENAENRTWSELFHDGWKFWRQCVNMIDTTWGRIYFLTCENFGLSVQWP